MVKFFLIYFCAPLQCLLKSLWLNLCAIRYGSCVSSTPPQDFRNTIASIQRTAITSMLIHCRHTAPASITRPTCHSHGYTQNHSYSTVCLNKLWQQLVRELGQLALLYPNAMTQTCDWATHSWGCIHRKWSQPAAVLYSLYSSTRLWVRRNAKHIARRHKWTKKISHCDLLLAL